MKEATSTTDLCKSVLGMRKGYEMFTLEEGTSECPLLYQVDCQVNVSSKVSGICSVTLKEK